MGKRKSQRSDTVTYRNVHRHSRKRMRRWTAFFALVLLLGSFAVLSVTVLFKTKEITVTGNSRYDSAAILDACGLNLADNLFRQDRAAAKERLEKTLPYLKNCQIKIKLPDTVVIEVAETAARLAIRQGEKYLLVDADGKALEATDQVPQGVYPVTHLEVIAFEPGSKIVYAQEQAESVLRELLAALSDSKIAQIREIDLENLYSIRLRYGDLYQIRLGTVGKLKEKLTMVNYVIENELTDGRAGILDISGDSGKVIFRPDYESIGVIIAPEETENE